MRKVSIDGKVHEIHVTDVFRDMQERLNSITFRELRVLKIFQTQALVKVTGTGKMEEIRLDELCSSRYQKLQRRQRLEG